MSSSEPLPSLTPAMEDYLEAIYHLENERRIARVRDIARRLDVKMSSVSSALKSLSSRGLIRYDPHQYITLTDHGIQKAKEIVRRHEVVKRFLSRVLYVDDAVAEDNACRMEHSLDPEVIEKLVTFMDFVEMCPLDQTRWQEGLSTCSQDCISCLDAAKKRVHVRAKVQKAAVADGMTLAEAELGAQVIIEAVKGAAGVRKQLTSRGLEPGAIVEIEGRNAGSGEVRLSIKGYHLSIGTSDAAKILVKPI
ncbi:MAG: metal-dependent transcriptional regulator [Desulfomonile sp.]|nr:metal-dependent transcriptional regulator [Desulfomonile sp.]